MRDVHAHVILPLRLLGWRIQHLDAVCPAQAPPPRRRRLEHEDTTGFQEVEETSHHAKLLGVVVENARAPHDVEGLEATHQRTVHDIRGDVLDPRRVDPGEPRAVRGLEARQVEKGQPLGIETEEPSRVLSILRPDLEDPRGTAPAEVVDQLLEQVGAIVPRRRPTKEPTLDTAQHPHDHRRLVPFSARRRCRSRPYSTHIRSPDGGSSSTLARSSAYRSRASTIALRTSSRNGIP